MRISQVCIDRPVLASVMSLVIGLFGAIALTLLQNRELPDVDPPVVTVTTIFPGAAPEVVETSVTDVIEDQVNGIEGVKHVTSLSREQVSQVTIEFNLGRDLEAAANDVRDRVARVRRELPEEVEEPIVAKRDSDANADVWLALWGDAYDQVQLSSMAETRLIDRLSKLPGVATVIIAGERRYSIRLWINNRRLSAHDLTIADVAAALQRENVDLPSGRLESDDTEFTVRSLGELRTAEEFSDLIVANVDGSPVYLRDLGHVEIGPEDVRKLVRYQGQPAIGMGVVKQSKANTLDVGRAVQAAIPELQAVLPPGANLEVAFDRSRFIRRSIEDVTRTMFEAALLVVLVIYVFLRTFRATLIPAAAIPVSVLGAFAVLYFLGFTINTLTLMGVTLAIGLVVDDAIVVLENIQRWVEGGTPPMEAARRGMQEISFAVVAATVSAVAVFLPLTFLTDTTGRLFREFAVVVAAALSVSGFVAVTLSPALCARVLRRKKAETGIKARFARFFEWLSGGYARALAPVVRRPGIAIAVGVLWLGLGGLLYGSIDQELIPHSDRNFFLTFTRAPEGATVEYMDRYQKQVEDIVIGLPEVDHVFSVIALGLGTPGLVNEGLVIAALSDRSEREREVKEVIDEAQPLFDDIPGIFAFASAPRPLSGFSSSPASIAISGPDLVALAGFEEEIEDRVSRTPGFRKQSTNLYLNKPQLEVEIDRQRANDLGVSVRDVASMLKILLAGEELSTFKLEGETYNVVAQLQGRERRDPRDVLDLSVRGNDGALVSMSQVIRYRETIAPRAIPHYDRQRSVTFSTDLEDGLAQGAAIEQVLAIADDVLPEEGYGVQVTGEAEKFYESGSALAFAYVLAVLIVYLVLAAQFESFVHPFTILVAVALSFTGALIALQLTGTSLNLYSKIGLVMLVGLVTKNSILIVEFANQLRDRGNEPREAVFQAARTRFRPILMTALATMMGILPIALGTGAGGASRAPLGIAVVGGMFFSTALTFFVVPATYLAIARTQERLRRRTPLPRPEAGTPAAVAGS